MLCSILKSYSKHLQMVTRVNKGEVGDMQLCCWDFSIFLNPADGTKNLPLLFM